MWITAGATTLAGFRAWTSSEAFPETGNIAYLGGELFIDMSPERIDSHNKLKTEVTRVIANLAIEEDLGTVYSDRTRIVNVQADLSCEPNLTFCLWQTLEGKGVRLILTAEGDDYIELEGSPDWFLEIISPSSVEKDTERLLRRYHKAGIREYWLIDARGDKLKFSVFNHAPNGYLEQALKKGWAKSKVFGRSFRLRRFKDRLGTWAYRLETKE
ncbi:MAG: Uma2 family endonuclease [Planctomycetes bacterium]|nr:Uma2 family endonuclease [Planctomycetota bacterium]